MQHIEFIPSTFVEMRESLRNPSWKWELKIKGLSMTQVERLSKEVLYQKPKKETPVQVAGIEPPRMDRLTKETFPALQGVQPV
jgi:hypothetical protein